MKMIPRVCEVCEIPFLAFPGQIKAGCGKYCSRKCALAAQHSKTPEERFWSYVQKTDTCWIWTGHKTSRGYGKLKIEHRTVLMNRYSYELHYGKLEEGMCALHKCDNPPCVNPDHLFAGTIADNNNDRARKGRNAKTYGRNMKGEANPISILTIKKVLEIRRMASCQEHSITEIAKLFGVSLPCVSHVVARRTWKHI